ncbi:MAG: gamma-glutamyltransferase, partial [Ginsengibacter sp.]
MSKFGHIQTIATGVCKMLQFLRIDIKKSFALKEGIPRAKAIPLLFRMSPSGKGRSLFLNMQKSFYLPYIWPKTIMPKTRLFPFFFFLLYVSLASCAQQNKLNHFSYKTNKNISCKYGAVVSAHALASQVGVNILKEGGNAVDAAIATQLALAVVYPGAGNIGGGGFMVAHLKNGENISIDYRETAPAAASRDMYLD